MVSTDDRPLRVGVIGCGAIGAVHMDRLARDRRVRLVVVSDPEPERAEQAAAAFNAESTTCHRDAIERFALDAVVLCSPTVCHFEQAMLALDNGLHVLCEKPLAVEKAEILQIADRSERDDRVFAVAYQRRSQAVYVTARRELQQRHERYGRLRQVHVFVCERWAQTIAGTWRNDPRVGSGYFGDAGAHQIDSVFFIAGVEPVSVEARSSRRDYDVEIVTAALAELSGGVEMVAHFVGDAHHWREDIHFHCENADLLIRGESLWRCEENRCEPIADLEPDSDPDRAFVDAILEGATNPAPALCALPMWRWTDAIMRSLAR